MAVREILPRYNTESGYDYLYFHSPFEVVTPSDTVTNTSGVYNIPTKVPYAHYTRPILVAFQAPSACVAAQKVAINGGTGILIKPSYRADLVAGDIPANAAVILYVDLVKSIARLISVDGASAHASYFTNNYGVASFPANSQSGDMLWNSLYTWASTTQSYTEVSIYNGTTGVVQYPVTPRQVYYATATSKSGAAYSVTLGEFPLTRRSGANKYGIMFIARFANASTGNDTITIDGSNYGQIRIGTGATGGFYRGLFAGEIKANQTCTFQINQDGAVYLLFIDGKAATGAGSTITLSPESAPPTNPLSKDVWFKVVKVVSS